MDSGRPVIVVARSQHGNSSFNLVGASLKTSLGLKVGLAVGGLVGLSLGELEGALLGTHVGKAVVGVLLGLGVLLGILVMGASLLGGSEGLGVEEISQYPQHLFGFLSETSQHQRLDSGRPVIVDARSQHGNPSFNLVGTSLVGALETSLGLKVGLAVRDLVGLSLGELEGALLGTDVGRAVVGVLLGILVVGASLLGESEGL